MHSLPVDDAIDIAPAPGQYGMSHRMVSVFLLSVIVHLTFLLLPFSPLPGQGGDVHATLVALGMRASHSVSSATDDDASAMKQTRSDTRTGTADPVLPQEKIDQSSAEPDSVAQAAEAGAGGDDALALRCPQRPAPAYPEDALRDGEEGRVEIEVRIAADGRVRNAVVLASSGRAHIDRAAVEFALGWTCRPAPQWQGTNDFVAAEYIEFSLP